MEVVERRLVLPILGTIELHFLIIVLQEVAIGTSQSLVILPKPSPRSPQGGRRFNPHGPGFDPETMQRKNSQACTVCHGAAIPQGGD